MTHTTVGLELRGRMRRALVVPVVMAIAGALAAACTSTEGALPTIDSLEPVSGPAGTVVLVKGTALGTSPDLLWNGTAVDNEEGGDTRVLFTVPYTAPAGNHSVTAMFEGNESAPSNFQVTGPQAITTPTIDGYSVRYYSLGGAGDEDVMNLVLFGEGFDTNSVVEVDQSDVLTFNPARPVGWILDALGTGYVLQGAPVERLGNVIAGRLSLADGNLPALGSTHDVRVRNGVNGSVSDTLEVTIPTRRVLVETDRINDSAVVWPPAGIWRDDTLNTLGRAYTDAGLLIDHRLHETVIDPNAGAAFTDADLLGFFNAESDLAGDVYSGEWYFHAALLTSSSWSSSTFVVYGMLWDTADRQGLAVFVADLPADQNYLRTQIHEMGHGFNLTHCEGDSVFTQDAAGDWQLQTAGTTLMNQSWAVANDWTYEFGADSRDHLTNHPVNEVEPGPGNLAFNSSMRTNGECGY